MNIPVICQLSDFSPEYPGSFVDSLSALARYCRQSLQIETLCVFPEKARDRRWLARFRDEGVRCAFVPPSRSAVSALRNVLNGFDPLIFHSHFNTFDLSAIALKLTSYRSAKVVWHFHSVAKMTPAQRLKDAAKVNILARRFGDLFISVAAGPHQNAIDRGFPPDKISLQRNGIDVSRFVPDEKQRLESRVALNVTPEQNVFLLLGYNPMVKGVDIFIKAASQQSTPHNCVFIIVARNETREFVAKLPESQSLGSALRIINPTDNFPQLLKGIDTLVASSRTEGLSYAVLEAMASGKLVLCSDIPGVRENYGGVEGLWLFPNEDWQELGRLMQQVRSLPCNEKQRLGSANCRYVNSNFSITKWAEGVGSAYRRLLST